MRERIRFCGVDVGSSELKLACLLEPTMLSPLGSIRGGSMPTPGAWMDGTVPPEALAEGIRRIGSDLDARMGLTPAAISIRTDALVTKNVYLPELNASERRAALYMELERLVPAEDGEPVGDFLPVAPRPDQERGTYEEGYLLMAVQEKVVQHYRSALSGARLRPVAVEPEPASLYRLSQLISAPEQGAAQVLIDLGASGTRLLVVKGEQLLLFRELPVGGNHLTAALAEHLRVDPAEAEQIKRTQHQEETSLEYYGEAGERLCREVERSLRYIERGYGLESYAALHLVGGGARWPFLRRMMERAVGIRAQPEIRLLTGAVEPALAQAAALALWQGTSAYRGKGLDRVRGFAR